MQDIHDVDVSFHRMFCIHHMALQTMRRVNGVVHCVLYLFYFLALPFLYPFLFITVVFYYISAVLQVKVLLAVSGQWLVN